jgi:nucleotide-binding universal stress UspA family protein
MNSFRSSPGSRPGVARVVAGACGSPVSLVALRYAEFLARAHDAVLVPVLAWEPPGGDRAAQVQPAGSQLQVWHDMACQRLRNALAALRGKVPSDPRVQPQLERGPAGWVPASIAARPGDVLVVGAGRRGMLRHAACCRVSRYCAAHARCPVVLIPPPDLGCGMTRSRIAWQLRYRSLTPAQVAGFQRKAAPG